MLSMILGLSAAENYAVVDYQKVIQQSSAFQSFQKQAADNKKSLEGSLNKETEALKAMEKDLVDRRSQLSEAEFNKKRSEFESKLESFKSKLQAKQAEFENNNAAALKTIENQSKKIIADIVKQKKYDIVYQAAGLAYFQPSVDISAEVLEKLNKSLSKITLKKVS
jgi:Skp family chaperone for outer membrane proteins